MPDEVQRALMVDTLCTRYGVLPSQLIAEDVSMLRMLAIVAEAYPDGR